MRGSFWLSRLLVELLPSNGQMIKWTCQKYKASSSCAKQKYNERRGEVTEKPLITEASTRDTEGQHAARKLDGQQQLCECSAGV
jgi:hypothetical protein